VGATACGPADTGSADAGPPGPPATFTEIYDKFFPAETRAQCNQCHSLPPNDISNGNLSMGADKPTAYAALIDVDSTSSRCPDYKLVVAGDPEHSLLYLKTDATPPCAGRMPLGGSGLTDDEREMFRSWIADGAKDN
jgi:hypothetical protein